MNRELEPLLVLVDQTFHFKKIVLLKSVEHFVDVVPHLGFQLTASVAQSQRQVRLTGLLGLDLFRNNHESGGDDLVLVADAIADVKVLHGMSEYRTKKAIGDRPVRGNQPSGAVLMRVNSTSPLGSGVESRGDATPTELEDA